MVPLVVEQVGPSRRAAAVVLEDRTNEMISIRPHEKAHRTPAMGSGVRVIGELVSAHNVRLN